MSTALLLHCNTSPFEDASGNNAGITTFGSPSLSTADKKFGAGSLSCPDANAFLRIVPGTAFSVGSQDVWTIDWWQKLNDLNADQTLFSCAAYGTTGYYASALATSGRIRIGHATAALFDFAGAVSAGVWQHVALVRYGANESVSLYVDGVHGGTTALNGNAAFWFDNVSALNRIGAPGYMDEFRITHNEALWTTDFTPPTAEAIGTLSLYAINPSKGPTVGGNAVTLKGSGFVSGTTATIDGNDITGLSVVNDTTITGYAPAGTLGLKNVVVTSP